MPAPPKKLEELIGVFDRERIAFQDDEPEKRTVIASLESMNGNDPVVVKGRAKLGALECGITYRFVGWWTLHEKYGRQFFFDSFSISQPAGERGTVLYLSRARGIGRRIAQQIWNLFGSDCLQTLREQPEAVADQVKGLTVETARAAAEMFQGHQALESVTVELADLLAGRGFPRTLPSELVEKFSGRAGEVVKENPYVLMLFKGCGFLKVDKLYLELGKDPAAMERQAYCAWHAIHADTEGSTWFPTAKCVEAVNQNVSGAKVDVAGALKLAIEKRLLVVERREETEWAAEYGKSANEMRVANFVHQAMMEGAATRWPDVAEVNGLTDHQREELAKAFAGPVGCQAGRPGTGKTYTLARVIQAVGGRVAICAPTGKAAVRVTESLAKQGVTLAARTIHSTLGVQMVEGKWAFTFNESNPLPVDYIFVDESSMIDTDLMASLLAARSSGTHVLFVGDPDQLSPVSHGAPLRDFIAAGLPCGHLKEILRNSGRIVSACKSIAETHRYVPALKADLAAADPENLVHIEHGSPEQQIAELDGFLDRMGWSGKWDQVWDVQILVAVNKKSPLGRVSLNKHLQGKLNAQGEQVDGNPFRVDDKIICLKNGMFDQVGDKAGMPAFVANGELAQVMEVNRNYTVAKLSNPDRVVKIPKGKSGTSTGDQENEEESGGTGCDWDLGYAITVHKSQGSDWPVVVILADSYPGARRLVDRHHVYTAFSRAKELCVCIGKKAVLLEACGKSHMWKRKTFLVERIEELQREGVLRAWDQMLSECGSDFVSDPVPA